MEQLVVKCAQNLSKAGLCSSALVAGRGRSICWNRANKDTLKLSSLFENTNIAGLVFGCPAQPFACILDWLTCEYTQGFVPQDAETRNFLHKIPVLSQFYETKISAIFAEYKAVLIAGQGILTQSPVSPEQAMVHFSSVCFACFVFFFAEYLHRLRTGSVDMSLENAYQQAIKSLEPINENMPELIQGSLLDKDSACAAMIQAGRAVVEYKLVDSAFGNISCCVGDNLLISKTGSFLDGLEGEIVSCPLTGTLATCPTASSELEAHLKTYTKTSCTTMLHGHPLFSVILSMDCQELENGTCETGKAGLCHIHCTAKRYLPEYASGFTAPIVAGEVGAGEHGLCHTLPSAMQGNGAAAVWGHGVFTLGHTDFREPFAKLLQIEKACKKEYFWRVAEAR